MHCVAEVELIFRLNTQTNSTGTEYASLQYLECRSSLDEVSKKLDCVSLTWSTRDAEDHSAVVEEKLDGRTELNVGE